MGSRLGVAFGLVVVLLLSGCTIGYQSEVGVERPAPDADVERLGEVDGYWYDQSLDVDPSDGVTEAEKEAIVSRAMARVQVLRGLEFEERPEVELLTRAEFQEEYPSIGEHNRSDAERILDNVQHEALFLVGPDRDVADVRAENRGDSVLGFYVRGQDRIVVVSESDPATFEDEYTLAHELLHALQDQRLELGSAHVETIDGQNAYTGLIEGDAVLIETRYERNCETGEWECVELETGPSAVVGEDFHYGVYFLGFFPYAEGPSFVEYHETRGGWDAVDAIYDEPPTTAAEIVDPARYGEGKRNVTIEDRNDGFERVRPGGTDYGVLGKSGVTTMFAYTLYEDSNPAELVEPEAFLNYDDDGSTDEVRPLTYDIEYATGWEGDRLHAYERENETAYVWRLAWNDEANATQFVDGHASLVEYWGGERIEHDDETETAVWHIPEESRFTGALWVQRDGNRVTVVAAPTVDDLGEVYAEANA